jgi:hypothetical protein
MSDNPSDRTNTDYSCPLCGRRLVSEPDGTGRFIVSCPDGCTAESKAGMIGETTAEAYTKLVHYLKGEP